LTDNISKKDKKDWENFISSEKKITNKDHNPRKKIYYKIKSLDLHGYTLEDANKLIQNFINRSYEENVNKLIVVTGKGLHSNTEKDPYVSKDLIISGDPEKIKKIYDTRIFSRDTTSANPNWQLVSTLT
jgi:hypothetical protein